MLPSAGYSIKCNKGLLFIFSKLKYFPPKKIHWNNYALFQIFNRLFVKYMHTVSLRALYNECLCTCNYVFSIQLLFEQLLFCMPSRSSLCMSALIDRVLAVLACARKAHGLLVRRRQLHSTQGLGQGNLAPVYVFNCFYYHSQFLSTFTPQLV